MTLANQITLARIFAIPVFVAMAIGYGRGVQVGHPQEWQRLAAILIFTLAAASDGLDGFVARHYNQRTRLGQILDPLADKGLLLAGILTLTFSNWRYAFPLWFPILVISRDVIVVVGSLLLHLRNGEVRIHTRWTGKIATILQMAALGAAMLQNVPPAHPGRSPFLWMNGLVGAAGLFTFLSGIGYVVDGIRQLHAGDHANL